MIEEKFIWDDLSGGTSIRLHIPGLLLEEFVYLFRFCQTAEFFSKDKRDIPKRYTTTPKLLKKDLHDGLIIEKRLESLVPKSQDSPLTNQFANEYLPYVKKFNTMVREYAASLQNKQEQP